MAKAPSWTIERLAKRHNRAKFSCGDATLDSYLRKYAGQNERLNIGRHYVAVEPGSAVVLGYYSLSASSLAWDTLSDDARKKLPKYPVPVAHLGRLAVDQTMQGQGLGEYLLMDALTRVVHVTNEIAIQAVELVAANERAKQFYMKYGFLSLLDNERHLYVAVETLRKLGLGQSS